jgi:hypothetical protein
MQNEGEMCTKKPTNQKSSVVVHVLSLTIHFFFDFFGFSAS